MPTAGAAGVGFSSVDLILLRHGQSEGNVFPWQGPLGGRDPPLTAAGRGQASGAAQCLAGRAPAAGAAGGGRCARPDLVLSSRLLRAMETALLAFPRREVHVAPHVMEVEGSALWLHPASNPEPRGRQLARVREDLGPAAAERLSFDWLPEPGVEGYQHPDWGQFLSWLWGLREVQRLLAAGSAGGAPPCIALVSHGNFLGELLRPLGWRGHPRNAVAVLTSLGIVADGGAATGFGPLSITGVLCEGAGGWAKTIWASIAALALLSAALGIAHRLRGRQRALRGGPAAEASAIELRGAGAGRG